MQIDVHTYADTFRPNCLPGSESIQLFI